MNIQEIKKLPKNKRILLAQDIWDSIEGKQNIELSSEIKNELDKRIDKHNSGKANYMSLSDVREKLSKLRK